MFNSNPFYVCLLGLKVIALVASLAADPAPARKPVPAAESTPETLTELEVPAAQLEMPAGL